MPDFKGGKLHDYAMWKRDWKDLISGQYDPNHELRMIRDRVPEKVRGLVERLMSMDEVWTLLDDEFGKKSELVSDRVDHLHAFQYSKGANSESRKFMELYERWAEVLFDLESVEEQQVLNHTPTIRDFVKLLPGEAIMQRYVATEKELSAKGESALAIVKAFMKSERSNQRKIMEITGAKESSSKDSAEKVTCFKCNQPGHTQANCLNKSTG